MENPIANYWKLRLTDLKEALEGNNFEVFMADNAADAAEVMGLTAQRLKELGLIDDIIEVAATGTADVIVDLRESVMEVLVDLARHRQQGADLLYEAYAVDIGGY